MHDLATTQDVLASNNAAFTYTSVSDDMSYCITSYCRVEGH